MDADSLRLWTEGVGATPRALCTIKREIGILHEDFGIETAFRRQSDANAGANGNFASENMVRHSERTLEALGQLCRLRFVCGPGLKDRKFITAQPGHEIRSPQDTAKPLGDALQQGIPNGMSESVIHLFEVVEIDPMKGKSTPGLQRPTPIFQLLAELMPIGNPVSVSWRANQSIFSSARRFSVTSS
jgi:hypothetical protein